MTKIYADKQMMLSEYADILDCDINHSKYEYTVREIIEDSNEINKHEIITPYLDKIRAEIDDLDRHYDNDYFSNNKDAMFKCDEVMQIIDKYRSESGCEEE